MKKIILSVAVAAMTLASGSAALAQPYAQRSYDQSGYDRGYDQRSYDRSRDSDRDGRPDYQEWGRDRDRDGRPDQYDRYDNRRGHGAYRGDGRWRQGQVYPYYRQRTYIIEDYRAYRLPPPQRGYRYYRSDNGDVVMVAIASGLIGAIIGGALNNNDHDRYDSRDHYRRY